MFTSLRRSFPRGLSALVMTATVLTGTLVAAPALAQFQQTIRNDPARCRGGSPAIRVNVSGIESASGMVRVQLYRGIESDWLERGRWLYRIESPARAGAMSFCLPVPEVGPYAVAVRHDVNGNGETDLRTDGGAMSNNPSINIFNLGRPSINRTRFQVGGDVVTININMRYM
jgi:uncharacterized protein (DUF2141 family)